MRIAFASTPVGALGSGVGGGVELTLKILALGLSKLGHSVEIFAPSGSVPISNLLMHQIDGSLQTPAQEVLRSAPIPDAKGSVLANIWEAIQENQDRFDVVLNFAYDALPMRMTTLLRPKVAHLVSMASLTDAMDQEIVATSFKAGVAVAMHSRAQAETFRDLAKSVRILGSGIDLGDYLFNANQNGPLGFVGRVSPEKGIEDAVAVSARTKLPLHVWGLLQDENYLSQAIARHPGAEVVYRGFVSSQELGSELGECRALLVTSKWVEAFGNVVIEAMACGVPAITYQRGGPAEIVRHGETGFVVAPDDVNELVDAVTRIGEIQRHRCREHVAENYSAEAFALRVEGWLTEVLSAK